MQISGCLILLLPRNQRIKFAREVCLWMKSNRPELKLNLLGRAMVPKTTRIRIAFMGLYKRTFFIAASVGEFD